jgi:hypothetical protein
MRKILVFCIALVSLLIYAEKTTAMIEKTKGSNASIYVQERSHYLQNDEIPFDMNVIIDGVLNRPEKNEEILLREDEFLIDSNIVYGAAEGHQRTVSVAFDGTNYLVVWDDMRLSSHYSYRDIYGTRVSQSGVILDSAGIAISTAPYDQRHPAVEFDGTNFLVTWDDLRNDESGLYDDIYVARVNQQGVVLDPDGIAISTAPYDQRHPSVAFDGTNYFVVWQDNRNVDSTGYDIYGTRVDQDGTALDPDGIAISNATHTLQWAPSVAFDGSNFLVVWANTPTAIYGARVDQQGAVLDPEGIAISSAANWRFSPSVTFGGNSYLVVWQDERSGNYDIYGARLDTSGVVLDPDGIIISSEAQGQMREPSSVISDGNNYLVVWTDYRSSDSTSTDIYGARVNQQGSVLDPDGIAISDMFESQKNPTICFNGSNFLCIWEDTRGTSATDIYGARIEQSGTVIDPDGFIVSTSAYGQKYSAAAFDGTNYLVAWRDSRNYSSTGYDIYGGRVNQEGIVLDPDGIPVSTAFGIQSAPAIAFDGSNYFVVWEDNRNVDSTGYDIYGTRIDQSGTVLDPEGISICIESYRQCFPSISFDGTNYLVVWEDGDVPNTHIYGTRINQSGSILDPGGFIISPPGYQGSSPSISFDGTNYLVVWHGILETGTDISGARVNQQGVVLDPNGIPISTASHAQVWSSCIFGGSNYFVVWSDLRNAETTGYDIYGARVNPEGVVLDPAGIAVATDSNRQFDPTAVFDGSNYFVTWADRHGNSAYVYDYDIYGGKVNMMGQVIDNFGISVRLGEQCFPAVAHGLDNQVLVTYTGFVDNINVQPAYTPRIWGKFYSSTGVDEIVPHTTPDLIHLDVYPTIFSKALYIEYSVQQSVKGSVPKGQESSSYKREVALKIYDAMGRLVKLFNCPTRQSFNQIIWSGADGSGRPLPTGVYFVRLEVGDYEQTEKVLLLR